MVRWPRRWILVPSALAAAAVTLCAGTAAAHPGSFESGGPVAAAEHAAIDAGVAQLERRRERRWRALPAAARRREAARRQRQAEQYASATAGNAARVGSWTKAPFLIPGYAIHAVLLPTGKVMAWGYPPLDESGRRPNTGRVWIWDPSLGTDDRAFHLLSPPIVDPDGADGPQPPLPAPIYCSGQSLLANGNILIAGGNLVWPQDSDEYDRNAGLNRTFTFNPFNETWSELPAMNQGRWYPSQVLMADGRTLVAGGYSDRAPGGIFNRDFEVFDPGSWSFRHLARADRTFDVYPHLFALPSGKVLLAGQRVVDSTLFTIPRAGAPKWRQLGFSSRPRFGGTAILRPGSTRGSSRVTQIGGYGSEPDAEGIYRATRTTETIGAESRHPLWQPDAPLRIPRSNHNTVLLPDGSMVTVGGGLGFAPGLKGYAVGSPKRRRVELLRAHGRRWRLGPAQQEDRAYHSVALLLPDGRVLSAGDDLHGPEPVNGLSTRDTGEVYSPPYLFRGPRPRVLRAPEAVAWGDEFGISTGKRKLARRAVLVAPGATTHATDMSQRVVRLKLAGRHGHRGIDVIAPPSPNVAPPGFYMLFTLSSDGVPSKAAWIQLRGDAADAPSLAEFR